MKGPPRIPRDARNKQSETALMIACKNQSTESIKVLTQDKKWLQCLEAVDTKNRSALHFASEFGCTEFAKQLIENSIPR